MVDSSRTGRDGLYEVLHCRFSASERVVDGVCVPENKCEFGLSVSESYQSVKRGSGVS